MTDAFVDPRIDTDAAGTVALAIRGRGLAPSKEHFGIPIGRTPYGSRDYRIVLFPDLFRVIHLFYAWNYLEVVVTTEYDDCFQGVEVHVSNWRLLRSHDGVWFRSALANAMFASCSTIYNHNVCAFIRPCNSQF